MELFKESIIRITAKRGHTASNDIKREAVSSIEFEKKLIFVVRNGKVENMSDLLKEAEVKANQPEISVQELQQQVENLTEQLTAAKIKNEKLEGEVTKLQQQTESNTQEIADLKILMKKFISNTEQPSKSSHGFSVGTSRNSVFAPPPEMPETPSAKTQTENAGPDGIRFQ